MSIFGCVMGASLAHLTELETSKGDPKSEVKRLADYEFGILVSASIFCLLPMHYAFSEGISMNFVLSSVLVAAYIIGMKAREYHSNKHYTCPESLNLADLNLTDGDLRRMACSGRYSNLKELTLNWNPKITARGLAWIGKRGFENLQKLYASANPKLFSGTDWWTSGFQHVKVLDIRDTNISDSLLERMINEAEWVRNLNGLDLSGNDGLQKLPSNISKLSQLEKHDDYKMMHRFSGGGLIYKSCKNLLFTRELLELVYAHKAYGDLVVLAPKKDEIPIWDLQQYIQRYEGRNAASRS
jgi:Leucine-rich repeat (LRR) protein